MSSVGKSDAPVQQVLLSGVEKIPAEAEVVKIPSVTSMSVEPVRTVPVDVVTAKQTEAKPEEKESVKKSPTISGKYRESWSTSSCMLLY